MKEDFLKIAHKHAETALEYYAKGKKEYAEEYWQMAKDYVELHLKVLD